MAYNSARRLRSPTPMPDVSHLSLTPIPSNLSTILEPLHAIPPQYTRPPQNTSTSTQGTDPVPPSHQPFTSPTIPNSSSSGLHPILLRDLIIGFSDGLTVPFALTAGLSTLGSTRLVILGGLAELFSGAISMGLGAYMASATDISHYDTAAEAVRKEIETDPDVVGEKTILLLATYGVGGEKADTVVRDLKKDTEGWVKLLMDIQLRLERPHRRAPLIEATLTGLIYFLGGFLPMIPYFIFPYNVHKAFYWSIAICCDTLLAFGYIKGRLSGESKQHSLLVALQMLVMGACAAGASYGIVYGLNHLHGM